MKKATRRTPVLLLAAGVSMSISSVFPWVSVSLFSARGIDGWRGVLAIAGGLLVSVFAASQIWSGFVEQRVKPKLRIASIVLAGLSTGIFIEVAFRTLRASSEIRDLKNYPDLGLGDLADAFGQYTNSLAQQLSPRLGVGWYLGIASSCIALGLSIAGTFSRTDVAAVEGNQLSEDNTRAVLSTSSPDKKQNLFTKWKLFWVLLTTASVLISLGFYIFQNRSDEQGSRGPVEVVYRPSLEVKSKSRKLTTEVLRQYDKWNSFGWATYSEWADRFVTMSESVRSIMNTEEELRAEVEDSFSNGVFLHEVRVLRLFGDSEEAASNLLANIDAALTCSLGLPSNNECDPQFRKVRDGLSALKRVSYDLASYLD